jgi:hypothetical protein
MIELQGLGMCFVAESVTPTRKRMAYILRQSSGSHGGETLPLRAGADVKVEQLRHARFFHIDRVQKR